MSQKTAQQTTNICSACGTSYVNHNFLYITNVVDETLGRAGDKLFSFTNKGVWKDLTFLIEKGLYAFFYFLGLVRYNKDIEKALTGRSKLIWEEANRRLIPMEQVMVFGKHIEYYRARIKGSWFYFQSLPVPPWIPQEGYKWLDDKFILFNVLEKEGVPIPKTSKVSNLKKARENFRKFNKPVIIKPNFGSRGRHTTTNINDELELESAFRLASEITPWIVIQEHLHGSIYRATVINNKLVGFFRADPPEVTGDGIKTIKELIEEKNKNHHEQLSLIVINDDLNNFIKRKGFNICSVLPKNVTTPLSAKTGRMYGGYTKEMLNEVHPKMYSIFEKAGELMKAPVLGFDLIIEDPTKDPDTQKWGIIECNSLPFIDLHYFALEGPQTNLAKNVWDLWNTPRN